MTSTQVVTMRSGADFNLSLQFTRDQQPMAVTDPALDVRRQQSPSSSLLVQARLGGLLSQPSPGLLVVHIPASVTALYAPGSWWWDLFATVGGVRLCLIEVSAWIVEPHVTGVL